MSLNYRDNLVRAMRKDSPEFVPFSFSFTSTLNEKLIKETGTDQIMDYFSSDHYHANQGVRGVGPEPSAYAHDYSKYYEKRNFEREITINDWGVARQPGSFEHFTHIESPLINASSIKEIENYPAPDRGAGYRWKTKKEEVRKMHEEGFAVSGGPGHIFETAWQIRGMEEFLTDMYMNKSWCEAIIEKIFNVNIEITKEAAAAGVDVLRIGDDVGTQNGMMFSPELFRELFKPRYKAIIETAKSINPDILIWYHSDGKIKEIIPDLIEIGLDILNPIQPECMDPVKIKKEFGNDLSFWGTMGTQTVFPFGTPQEVEDMVKKMIDEVGYDGGLFLAPTHVLEPEVPLKNIEAFVKAIEKYGKY